MQTRTTTARRYGRAAILLITALILGGCGFSGFQDNLSAAILNNPDPDTIGEALPTLLVATDALIENDPNNSGRLRTGATLYTAYASLFVDDRERASRLLVRAMGYGERALCLDAGDACGLAELDYLEFIERLNRLGEGSVPSLYAFTVSWLAWAQVNSDDLTVLANLPKMQAALTHVLLLDETFQQGTAHVYMGMLKTLRPPSLGGKPDEGRQHFERALEISAGRNLSARVEYAASYARLIYDRELHDRLLQEVLAAPVEADQLTLLNVIAQRRAKELLENADDYF